MKTLEIHGSTGDSTIRVGETLQNLGKYIPAENVVIITDVNVKRFYQNNFPPHPVITIQTGEKIKNLDTVRSIYGKLVEFGVDRSTVIIGIGGGIVCDITGFVASTFLRGVKFGFVSSTLLSQVDASVGGKNGVNFKGYKNMVGVFSQPEFVICDINLLNTLPQKEVLCGLAEIVKHAAIGNADLFKYLEEHYQKSVVIKSAIVNKDEKEKGERRKLNFGHTFGHAIEKTTGARHGEAVSAGMVMASELSVRKGHLQPKAAQRIKSLLRNLKLPTRLQADRKTVFDALQKDKKRQGDGIYFVLLEDIGKPFVHKISITELEDVINDFY
ncbi:MAG: 3-dehydroquinate synthase [Deltaproteobacteria bacterium]|nr:3-dehydroquinate synthase [Deltaproteobacteria bacterium]